MECPECGEGLEGPMMFGEIICPECGYMEYDMDSE